MIDKPRNQRQMFRASVVVRSISVALVFSSLSVIVSAQSKFAGPFENYKRTGDKTAFDNAMAEMRESGQAIDFRKEVPVLTDLVAAGSDLMTQNLARDMLLSLAYQLGIGLWISSSVFDPKSSELFRPAMAIFESHLKEALLEPEDTHGWSHPIASLTALLGLQPSPPTLVVLYRMAKSKHLGDHGLGLLALARLKPLPPEAKRIILSRTESLGVRSTLDALGFALDDPDVLNIFLKSILSDDVGVQRDATKRLSWTGTYPEPIRDVLRRLQQRKDLDEYVAEHVKAALDRIENASK